MNKETRYIITKNHASGRTQYLAHRCPGPECPHGVFWTFERWEAMEYTKYAVADGLAAQQRGTVTEV